MHKFHYKTLSIGEYNLFNLANFKNFRIRNNSKLFYLSFLMLKLESFISKNFDSLHKLLSKREDSF